MWDAGAIPAASTFSEHASTSVRGRQKTPNLPNAKGVASNEETPDLRQGATADVGSRPAGATESATDPPLDDADLAIVVAAWPDLPKTVHAGIVAMVKAARV
jgi:hypothetical protein